jgi:hypothetical protein
MEEGGGAGLELQRRLRRLFCSSLLVRLSLTLFLAGTDGS